MGLRPRALSRICLLLLLTITGGADGFEAVSPAQAIGHVREKATVCGRVANAKYAVTSKGSPTFLNLDKPYPEHVFTAVIWEENRAKFTRPPESLVGRRICVSGLIDTYKGRAQIVVSEPSQIAAESVQ